MENKEVIKRAKKYLEKEKTLDLKWLVKDIGAEKNNREIDIINNEITNCWGFSNYTGHNPNDISIKYSSFNKWALFFSAIAGFVGLVGAIFSILSFFCN